MCFTLPCITTGYKAVNEAIRIAFGDLIGNMVPFRDGLLDRKTTALMAGLHYDTPWTRDAAINTWNGTGLLFPDVSKSTLLSVLKSIGRKTFISGQYWDSIIWSIGAWWQYLFTGDRQFLSMAFDAVRNTMELLEAEEYDPEMQLFRGPAVYGDGVGAYPDIYTHTDGSSQILSWPEANRSLVSKPGYGIPMYALSTNCVYYQSYILLKQMAEELGVCAPDRWERKASGLKAAINMNFWDEVRGSYGYIRDTFGNCDFQEGLGQCFAILFGIADRQKSMMILENQHITRQGIPCLWPVFDRYTRIGGGEGFGRHNGTVWPFIQALWAEAALRCGRVDLFEFELLRLAENACRDGHFAEIYHPETGEMYGGLQEGWYESPRYDIHEWDSCKRQSWSASGFLRMILTGLIGITPSPEGITFSPVIPDGLGIIHACGIKYRDTILDISIEGHGSTVHEFRIDDIATGKNLLPAHSKGNKKIEIKMK